MLIYWRELQNAGGIRTHVRGLRRAPVGLVGPKAGAALLRLGGSPRLNRVSSTVLYQTPTFMISRASSAVAILRPNCSHSLGRQDQEARCLQRQFCFLNLTIITILGKRLETGCGPSGPPTERAG